MVRFFSEWRAYLFTPTVLVVWLALTVVVALARPFGSGTGLDHAGRLAYWGLVIGFVIVIGSGARSFVDSRIAPGKFATALLVEASIMVGLCSLPLYLSARLVLDSNDANFPSLPEIAILLIAVTTGLCVLRECLFWADPPSSASVTEALPRDNPRLLCRLPEEMRAPIISISGRDHYVDVVTVAGSAPILMRFSDAVSETVPVEGIQIHRSHWVTWAAIDRVERDGVKVWVHVVGGAKLPVSRNHREKLAERGLL